MILPAAEARLRLFGRALLQLFTGLSLLGVARFAAFRRSKEAGA